MTYPHVIRYECPIGDCEWVHDDPGPDPSKAQGATTGEAVFNLLQEHMAGLELVVRAHLETHSLLEWVTEVMRLREQLAVQRG